MVKNRDFPEEGSWNVAFSEGQSRLASYYGYGRLNDYGRISLLACPSNAMTRVGFGDHEVALLGRPQIDLISLS
jgi:urease alpha subunit